MAAKKFHSTSPEELLKAANTKMMMIKGQTEPLSQEEINQLLWAMNCKPIEENSDGNDDFAFDSICLDEGGNSDENSD